MLAVLAFCVVALLWWLWPRRASRLSATDKAVFISGCDTGIGHRLARHCLQLGLTVFAGCLWPDGAGARRLRQTSGGKLTVVQLDVTQEDSIQRAADIVRQSCHGKGLWALLNNAGVIVCGEFDWLTGRQCRRQVDVNLTGAILVTKAFLPLVLRQKGRLVTITSVNGACAYPGISVYCATKFGLEGFNDSLRLELRKFGVHVAIVQPGDFARLTKIMADHEHHMAEMWNAMSSEKRSFYGDYFRSYHHTVLRNHGLTSPATFEQSTLIQDVEHALLAIRPRARYVSASFFFRIFFQMLRLLPTFWSDKLLDLLFRRVFQQPS